LELTVLEEKGNMLKIEIRREGHTLGGLLQHELLNDEYVEYAGYDVPHPLVDSMILYIRTVGRKNPRRALKEALQRLKSKLTQFAETFEKAEAAIG
jgi:DNA-directed RNA polymerase subunit L